MTQTRSERLPGRREMKKEANRQRLIEATIESIAERGLTETTVGSVVERAGLSRGLVSLHFSSKEALLLETLRFLSGEWQSAWRGALEQAGPEAADRLEALLLAVFEPPVFSRKKLAAWHAYWADAKYRATYRRVCGAADRAYVEELTGLCRSLEEEEAEKGAEEGGYGAIDAERVAVALQALTDGLWLDILTSPRTSTREEARRVCTFLLSRLFPRHFTGGGGRRARQSSPRGAAESR